MGRWIAELEKTFSGKATAFSSFTSCKEVIEHYIGYCIKLSSGCVLDEQKMASIQQLPSKKTIKKRHHQGVLELQIATVWGVGVSVERSGKLVSKRSCAFFPTFCLSAIFLSDCSDSWCVVKSTCNKLCPGDVGLRR